ncbi:acyl-CoA-binding protein [Flavobacteriaceae bacterium F08102]|nr:acyl-CoA-binding protein [Flavobacteriaceae bacterium F08102]
MKTLDERFTLAFEIASNMTQKLPADTMLTLYAYYKQATIGENYSQPSGTDPVRNAFKLNAWIQINNLSKDEAKKNYIKLVEEINNQKIV